MENRLKQSEELRKRAEYVFLEAAPENSTHFTPEERELRNTVYSLRVHQIELEMQNEELRKSQAQLEASQALYFDFYNLSPVGYLTISAQGVILEANLTAASLLGLTRSVLVNQPLTHFIHKEDQDLYYLSSKNLFKNNDPQRYDLRMIRKDNSVFWAHFRAMATCHPDGTPAYRIVLSDITGRKLAEEERRESAVCQREQEVLRISEARFREVLEHSLDAAYKRNLHTASYEYLSPVWEQLSGYTLEEMMAFPVATVSGFIHRDDVAEVERVFTDALADVIKKPYHLEYRFKHKDGQYRWIKNRFTVLRDAAGLAVAHIGSMSDITERKQSEAALREVQSCSTAILDSLSAEIAVIDPVGVIIAVNESWQRFALENSLDPDQLSTHTDIGSNYLTICQSDQEAGREAFQGIQSVLAGEATHYNIEYPCFSPGAERWFMMDVTALGNDGRKGAVVVHTDITERKQIEHLLVESRENYRRVFENQMMAICIVDTQTLQIVDVNDTHARLFGYSREELLSGMKIIDLSAEPVATAESILQSEASKNAFFVPLRYHRRKDGTIFPANIAGETYVRAGRLVTLGVVGDISQRMRVEKELQEIHSQLEHKVRERTVDLEKTNSTLAMMLDYARKTETDIQERVVANLRANILGIVDLLQKQQLAKSTQGLVELLETTTLNLVHPIARKLESKLLKLTTRELQLANFIRLGKSTKELMELLNISKKTVESHRNHLRKKLGILNEKINLKIFLNSEFAE